MIKVYIAGPYTIGGAEQNVANAIDAAERVSRLGAIPFVPHLSHFWHQRHNHSWEFWMTICIEWLKGCDCILRLPGESRGADIEEWIMRFLERPVFTNTEQLGEWIKSKGE